MDEGFGREEDAGRVAKVVGVVVVMIVMTFAGCDTSQTYIKSNALAQMVSSGADPIAAGCAMGRFSDETCRTLIRK